MHSTLKVIPLFTVFILLFSSHSVAQNNPYSSDINYFPPNSINIVNSSGTTQPPALSADVITKQVLFGVLAGGVGALLGGIAGAFIFECGSGWGCNFEKMATAAVVGYSLGSTFVIYALGNSPRRRASYLAVLLGNAAGLALGTAIYSFTQANIAGVVAALGLSLTGSIIAYNLTRHFPEGKITVAPSAIGTSPVLAHTAVPGVSFTVNF